MSSARISCEWSCSVPATNAVYPEMSAMTRRPSTAEMVRARVAPDRSLRAFEAQPEAGPAATVDGSLERDRAAVGFRDVFHDRKAEARAGKVARVIRSP